MARAQPTTFTCSVAVMRKTDETGRSHNEMVKQRDAEKAACIGEPMGESNVFWRRFGIP